MKECASPLRLEEANLIGGWNFEALTVKRYRDSHMPDEFSNATSSAQQVELAISQLDSLSTLPCIAAQFLPKLLQGQFRLSVLVDIIESDPALIARIFSLINQRGVSLSDGRFSLRQALDKIPAHDVRDAVLSVKVLQDFDLDDQTYKHRILLRRELLSAENLFNRQNFGWHSAGKICL